MIDAVAATPPVFARIVAVPDETPATTPLAFTVAIPVLLLLHANVRPEITFPFASRAVAVR